MKESKGVRSWKIPRNLYVPTETEKWDECPTPLPNEVFLSWFVRTTQANYSTPTKVFSVLLDSESDDSRNLKQIEFDITLKNELINKLTPYIKISPKHLKEMPFQTPKRTLKRIGWDYLNLPSETPHFCPFCLREDNSPYFRYYWQLRFITVCLIHNCFLLEYCPHCYAPVEYWKVDWEQPIQNCTRCRKNFTKDLKVILRPENPEELQFQA